MPVIRKPHNPNLWAEIMKDTAGLASFKPNAAQPPRVAQPSSRNRPVEAEAPPESAEGQ